MIAVPRGTASCLRVPAGAGADRRVAQPGGYSRGVSSVRSGESRLLGKREIARLLEDTGIICSHAKIEASSRGRAPFNLKQAMIDFSDWVWELARAKPIQKRRSDSCEYTACGNHLKGTHAPWIPICGPVIVYAWMRACGIVNDHTSDRFRQCSSRQEKKSITWNPNLMGNQRSLDIPL